MGKTVDHFHKTIESEKGRLAVRAMKHNFEIRGMNYLKFLCLNWQASAGKKCTKRSHVAGKYLKELECEAQLTECIVMQVQFASAFAKTPDNKIPMKIEQLFKEAYGK